MLNIPIFEKLLFKISHNRYLDLDSRLYDLFLRCCHFGTLLGSRMRELILFYLVARKQGYAREIANFYESTLSPIQIQLDRLEADSILVSTLAGKTRIYFFNPRYPFLAELLALLNKSITFLPQNKQDELLLVRQRPRRKNKPL